MLWFMWLVRAGRDDRSVEALREQCRNQLSGVLSREKNRSSSKRWHGALSSRRVRVTRMRCLAWRLFGRRRAVCGSPPGHGGGDSGEWRGRDMPARGRGLHDIYPRTQPPCVVMRAARSQCLSFPGPPRHQLPGRPHSRLARCMHARPGSHGR
ncbi:hypothetical protein SEVIR_6G215866v4 [Setaria viridis]